MHSITLNELILYKKPMLAKTTIEYDVPERETTKPITKEDKCRSLIIQQFLVNCNF